MKQEHLNERLDALSPEKRWLLQRMLGQKRRSQKQQPTIARVDHIEEMPLAFSQQRFWFLHQLQKDNSDYNICGAIWLSGPLDFALLETSIKEVIRRHAVLRTTFPLRNGKPVQAIADAYTLTLQPEDYTSYSEQEILASLEKRICYPFDLAQGPLFHLDLLQAGAQKYLLLAIMHHSIADAWSTNILIQEVSLCYQAYSQGKQPDLPELPIQYVDFAFWQRTMMQGEHLEKQLAFWQRYLSGDTPILQLPQDPVLDEFAHRVHISVTLASSQLENLNRALRREGVTLFMGLLAALALLLHRYSGQDEIMVVTPVAGRHYPEVEKLIGCFLNMLPLRLDLSGNPTVSQLLQRVRQTVLEAYMHQDVPFEKLVEEFHPVRNFDRNPFADIMVNVINTPQTTVTFPGLAHQILQLPEPGQNFAIALYAQENEQELRLWLRYDRQRFSRERMTILLEQLQAVLGDWASTPNRTLDACSLLTPSTREVLPDPYQHIPVPAYPLVPELFMHFATLYPELPALKQAETIWSYGLLAERASAIAQALLADSITSGDVVAVIGPHSPGTIAGMVGVILSGGVLLPISDWLPRGRQERMLSEANAERILMVQYTHEQGIFSKQPERTVWCVEAATGMIQHQEKPGEFSLPAIAPEAAAYIFFTSGTTGTPKGILGSQQGLAHFLAWQRQTFSVTEQDRVAHITDLSFDPVLREIFLPLTSGALLCLPENAALGPTRFIQWMADEHISLLHTVPSLAQTWLTHATACTLPALRCIFFAGEPLTSTVIAQWRERFSRATQIVNLYGPTETTLAKCFYLPQQSYPGVQPIGQPLPETQALILTPSFQLCGIGELGQIVIRTPFRCIRYINNPEEQRKRFIVSPFTHDENDMLYLTGDIGRYRPDGSLEIMGRQDHQVKIRGVRIEPGEIEAILCRHPNVEKALILPQKSETGEKRLLAYLVCQNQDDALIAEVRQFAKEQLPRFMLPAAFIRLDEIPLTPNGKINRAALPLPDTIRPALEQAYLAPQGELEQTIALIWQEVLDLEKVGSNDNFFDLGGHSLLLIDVQSKLQQALQREIPLIDLFRCPTIRLLTGALAHTQQASRSVASGRDRANKRHVIMGQKKKSASTQQV